MLAWTNQGAPAAGGHANADTLPDLLNGYLHYFRWQSGISGSIAGPARPRFRAAGWTGHGDPESLG